MANPSPLCLKCRKSGHIASRCRAPYWPRDQFTWFFSSERKALSFGNPSDILDHELCRRCQDLNILDFLHEPLSWKSTRELNRLAPKLTESFRSLGKAGNVEFWNNCPVCLCLFALTPSPSSASQDILLVLDWTMNRVSGETDTVTDMEGWDKFPKCLLVTLSGDYLHFDFSTKIHRGDALCIVGDDDPDHCLPGRLIAQDGLDINIIQDWLSKCSNQHSAKCRPKWIQELPHLKLVDLSTNRIVLRPEGHFDYIALSYVWGGTDQQSYQLGSELGILPQTIEDAISLVRSLGKRYLWVDSLCIDQSDEGDKIRQIQTMQSIYSGAYVTIIAVSGDSVDAGLPRLGNNKDISPQLTCYVDGKRLVGLMPTLSQQIWRAPWGKRAWTLQEALLSPRCLYVSDHQLYFECNGMQCCESLNDNRSWAHSLALVTNPAQGGWLASKVGDGCLRTPIDNPSHRIERYGTKLVLYSYRSMTHDSDALHAFSGIIQFLETMYTKGFFQGLPVEDFQWGLLWEYQWEPERRPGFPSWSWAGWKCGIWTAYPYDFTNPHEHPLHLRMWKALRGELVQFFASSHVGPSDTDPIAKAALLCPVGPEFDLSDYPHAEDNYLFIEAIVLEFVPDFRVPAENTRRSGKHLNFYFALRGTICALRIMGVDQEIDRYPRSERQRFLLLARDYGNDVVVHHLLMIQSHGNIAERETVLQLIVRADRLDVLEDLRPQKAEGDTGMIV